MDERAGKPPLRAATTPGTQGVAGTRKIAVAVVLIGTAGVVLVLATFLPWLTSERDCFTDRLGALHSYTGWYLLDHGACEFVTDDSAGPVQIGVATLISGVLLSTVSLLVLGRRQTVRSRGSIRAVRIVGWAVFAVVAVTGLLLLFVVGNVSASKAVGFYLALAAAGVGLCGLLYLLRITSFVNTTHDGLR